MKKKIVTLALLATSMGALAQDAPSRNYIELGYGVLDASNDPDIYHIDINHALGSDWTLGGEFFRLESGRFDLEHVELNFGFAKSFGGSSDFFTRIHVGHEARPSIGSLVYGLALGTRSTLSDYFQLHTELKYNEVEKVSNGYAMAEIKGVYTFTEQSGLALALQSWDWEDTGVELSYRHSF